MQDIKKSDQVKDNNVLDNKTELHKDDNKNVQLQKNEDNQEVQEVNFMDGAGKGLSDTIEVAGETVKAINETVKSAAETVKAVNEVINAVTSNDNLDAIVDDASKSIHQTIDAANDTVRAATEAVKQADQTIKVASQAITDIYTTVEEPIGEAIDMIGNKINEVLDPKNQKELLKSPIVGGVLLTLSLSLLTWGLYSFFRPKSAE